MGKKRVMLPVEEIDISAVTYQPEVIKAPYLTGYALKIFVWLVETPFIGPLILSFLKWQNKITEMMQNTVIPELPMYQPEFPPQEPEPGVILIGEDNKPVIRVGLALDCLPPYDPGSHWKSESPGSFLYWTIRDYAYAYRSKAVTPSIVAEHIIIAVEESNNKKPPMPLLISFNAEDLRKQAAASTRRFLEGNPLCILDGIFIAIKDDINCCPHPTRDGTSTTWFHKIQEVKEDAVCVSRLRGCGVIFIGKATMPELGLGITGNNPNYGTARNPHSMERYTGGSSSGLAAIVASGLCPAGLGTDGGGSIRVPSSLCGVVGLKTTFGRTDTKGSSETTVEVVAPLAATVEDTMLVYAAMIGSSPVHRIYLDPSPPCLPCLTSPDGLNALRSIRLGKYTEWFNDVHSTDISIKCDDALNLLTTTYGCQMTEIVLPELREMSNSLVVTMGSEFLSSLNPELLSREGFELTYETRIDLSLFQSFSAAEYVAAQRLRRRIMFYYMEAFKKVDVIVTPTTGMTAPIIPQSSLKFGESNLEVTCYLMRFVAAGNLLGLPAISVPVGHDKQGLPIGLQLIGRPWGEATILRLAYAVEELCLKFRNRPTTFYDILPAL